MILLCCGDRHWKDREMVAQKLYQIILEVEGQELLTIVEGEADGADKICRQEGLKLGIPVHPYPANWKLYDLLAGRIRNQEMLDQEHPDLVLAFHDDLAHSKGTADMVRRAEAAGIPVRKISHQLPPE
jgi:hypothetical protein